MKDHGLCSQPDLPPTLDPGSDLTLLVECIQLPFRVAVVFLSNIENMPDAWLSSPSNAAFMIDQSSE